MGAPKQKWTSEEEDALRAGVAKHGTGKWKNIQKDPEFMNCLAARSNIDLKDKWRNMSVSANGQGPRDKVKTPKLKALLPPPSSSSVTPSPLSAALEASANQEAVVDSLKSPADGKNAFRYNSMITDALSSMEDPNGSDVSSIIGFVEQKYDVSQSFKRSLARRLKHLVDKEKIEKVQNGYKIKEEGCSGKKASSVEMEKDAQHNQKETAVVNALSREIEEATKTAAYMIADAENKAFMASKAVEEAEKIAEMVEYSDSVLQLAKEIFERCSRGEIVLMA